VDEAEDGALDRHATVFLDVDGVLNSYPVRGLRYYREGRRTAHAWRFALHYRPAIVRALERVMRTREATLVWLSTWSHRCTEELEPALGFRDTHPVVPMPDDSYNRYAGDPHAWWKARHVAAWLDEDPRRRAVWVDDDLASPRTHAYFAQRYPDRLLMIVPEFARGLTESHLRTLRRFLSPRRRSRSRTLEGRRRLLTRMKTEKSTTVKTSAQESSVQEAAARVDAPRPPRVGLLDSGLGLVGFADAILAQAPDAELILAMDPDNMPYGSLTPERLREVAENSAHRLAAWEPDAIVVACNTASVHALEHLRSVFEPRIPVIGTVPAVKTAAARRAPFAVWATAATTGSEYQRRLIDAFAGGLPVTRVAAAGLAEAIESGEEERIREAVAEAAAQTPEDVASVVLGCTHYCLVGERIAQALCESVGHEVELLDSPQAVAAQTLRRVAAHRRQRAEERDAATVDAAHADAATNTAEAAAGMARATTAAGAAGSTSETGSGGRSGATRSSGTAGGRVLATYLSGRRAPLPRVLGMYAAGRRLLAHEVQDASAEAGASTGADASAHATDE
jgi:glutamate racemase